MNKVHTIKMSSISNKSRSSQPKKGKHTISQAKKREILTNKTRASKNVSTQTPPLDDLEIKTPDWIMDSCEHAVHSILQIIFNSAFDIIMTKDWPQYIQDRIEEEELLRRLQKYIQIAACPADILVRNKIREEFMRCRPNMNHLFRSVCRQRGIEYGRCVPKRGGESDARESCIGNTESLFLSCKPCALPHALDILTEILNEVRELGSREGWFIASSFYRSNRPKQNKFSKRMSRSFMNRAIEKCIFSVAKELLTREERKRQLPVIAADNNETELNTKKNGIDISMLADTNGDITNDARHIDERNNPPKPDSDTDNLIHPPERFNAPRPAEKIETPIVLLRSGAPSAVSKPMRVNEAQPSISIGSIASVNDPHTDDV